MAIHPGIQPRPATSEQLQPTPPPDVSIHISGNNVGNIYAGNRFNTFVGAVAGDMVTLVAEADIPLAEPRPRPVDGRPRDFAQLIGRLSEIRQATAALSTDTPVEICGPPGMGKTSLLRYLAWRVPALPDGVYHLRAANRPPEDVEEQLFAGFYRSRFPIKQYRAQLLEHLRPLQALIILDDLTADRDCLNELLDALPRSIFLLAAEDRRLWGSGRSLPLPGLAPDEGINLFAAELGRELGYGEREPVRKLCVALGGNPLAIVRAAAAYDDEQPLPAFLTGLSTSATPEAVSSALIGLTSAAEEQVLGVLAALGGVPLLPVNIAGATGGGNVETALASLTDMALVEQTEDGRYRWAGALPAGAGAGWHQPLLNHLVNWGRANHDSPELVARDAEAMEVMLGWADEQGQYAQAVALAHELDAPLTLTGHWASWDKVMETALHAARVSGMTAEKAWVLHQQGSRALVRGDASVATDALKSALALRQQLGDTLGANLTQYHLDLWRFLFPPPPPSPPTEASPSRAPARSTDPRPGSKIGGWRRLLRTVLIVVTIVVVAAILWPRLSPAPPEPGNAVSGPVDNNPPAAPPGNSGPALRILSPATNAHFPAGTAIRFQANAQDDPDGNISERVFWEFSNGGTEQSADFRRELPVGRHVVEVSVIDDDGQVSGTSLVFHVDAEDLPPQPAPPRGNPAPVLRILEPATNSRFAEGIAIRFRARAQDDPDGNISERVLWEFSSGGMERSADFRRMLPAGRHEVPVTVVDNDGQESWTILIIYVDADEPPPPPDTAPPAAPQPAAARQVPRIALGDLSIRRQTDNGAIVYGTATARDEEDGPLSDNIAWWLGSRQNVLGYGPVLETELPPGDHLIVVFVADSDNMGAEDERRIVVPQPAVVNTEPRIEIKRPLEGQLVQFREAVALSASAFDDQEGDISPAIVWWSDIDGQLGNGPDVIVDWLQPGLHTIIAEVTDAVGAQTRAFRSITVGSNQADLVAGLTQTGPAINADNVYILVPVRLFVENVGGVAAESFMVSAGGEGPGGRVQTTLVDMPGSDGRRVSIGEGMVAGQRVTLDGMLRIDSPEGLFGQVVSVWVMADNCTGDELLPDSCRVPENNEDNNRSPRIQVPLPARQE